MSCRQSRQSKEMDSEKAATSAAGPDAKRPERETTEEAGDGCFTDGIVPDPARTSQPQPGMGPWWRGWE